VALLDSLNVDIYIPIRVCIYIDMCVCTCIEMYMYTVLSKSLITGQVGGFRFYMF